MFPDAERWFCRLSISASGRGCGLSVKSHQPHCAGKLQHSQSMLQCHPDENITGEQHQRQFLAAVFPPPHRSVERQEAIDTLLIDLIRDAFFVARRSVQRVPVGALASHMVARRVRHSLSMRVRP